MARLAVWNWTGRIWSCRRLLGPVAGQALALGALAFVPSFARAAQEPAAGRAPVEKLLGRLREKYKDNEKKYAALVAKVDKVVRKRLASTPCPGSSADAPRCLDTHPWVVLVEELSAAVPTKAAKSAAPAACEILERFPWSSELELVAGLHFGSDRPVPPHENGFIELGSLPAPGPELPEAPVNHYLFGLHEIVGWRACVGETKKHIVFRGRTPKDPPPSVETELPPWEALRVYLQGSLPEVSLFAIPRLTQKIHERLAERRRGTDAAAPMTAPMDELLGLLDAHWNGFSFDCPYAKERTTIAIPILALIADRKGFPYRFPAGERLGTTGDIPFVSDATLQSYAQAMRGESLEVAEFIRRSPQAEAAREAFWRDCVYLSRYRALVDLCVRTILEPTCPLPAYLADFDFPPAWLQGERTQGSALDVPRKHALVLWAAAVKDPLALADLLQDNVLGLEVNRFPSNASLQSELAYFVRKHDAELLADLRAKAARLRTSPESASDFEREFSPQATDLDPGSEASTDFLVHSHRTFHEPVVDAIRDAAYEVVLAELGGK